MTAPAVVVAGPAHAAVLAALHARCFETPWDEDAFARFLALPGMIALIADAPDGAPVGFVLLSAAADEAEVLTIGVVAEARCAGVGRALLGGAEDAARDAAIATVFLDVAEDNAAARALYAAAGYGETARRPGYYKRPDGRVDALVLSRAL